MKYGFRLSFKEAFWLVVFVGKLWFWIWRFKQRKAKAFAKGEDMQQVTLQVADEVKALGDALAALAADIKAQKATAQIVSDILPGFLIAAGSYQNLAADMKTVDDQAYVAYALAKALEG